MRLINWWAVLASAVVQMVLGSVWYSPLGFGKAWAALVGFTPEKMAEAKKKGMGAAYGLMFAGCLVTSTALALLVSGMRAHHAVQGFVLGLIASVGFVAPAFLSQGIFEGRPRKLYFINAGYWVANLVLTGVILSAWR